MLLVITNASKLLLCADKLICTGERYPCTGTDESPFSEKPIGLPAHSTTSMVDCPSSFTYYLMTRWAPPHDLHPEARPSPLKWRSTTMKSLKLSLQKREGPASTPHYVECLIRSSAKLDNFSPAAPLPPARRSSITKCLFVTILNF